ncbi:MAG: Eco57I restriction-modification methylase domain-containing protein, partial [Candidatus Methylumidiphilus sp.]
MANNTDPRTSIDATLKHFNTDPLADAARNLLATLGYQSDRTLHLGSSDPQAFLDFVRSHPSGSAFDESKALFQDWKTADLLFQLTDEELTGQDSLFKETAVSVGLMHSYLFFAIELTGEHYARGKLTGIARQINRVFPMPVMVLLKHQADNLPVLSIAVINRRQNKKDAEKDVLGKVTIIRQISLTQPHRGHLDILCSLAVPNLVHPQRLKINNFETLHAAWEQIFNVELLNQKFYRELANWYFWALDKVEFPADVEKDSDKRHATSLIRLLTRLIFCWFLKEKGLIPDTLFVEAELKTLLKDLSPDASSYYQAVLQNLFFATLNQRMGTDSEGKPYRDFARDEGFFKNRDTYGVDTLYRYEELFQHPEDALKRFADVPFLNGGLFECLDRTDEHFKKKLYLDGFSRNKAKRPHVPNHLFFADEQTVDLSAAYGENKRKNEKVRGLLHILHAYKFTIVENTPIDQEIALDPELLGKVFENLLASYNEETKTTARKQTGSFYTPRPIVEYMVDESLKAHLTGVLVKAGLSEDDAKAGLDILFAYTEREHLFTDSQADILLAAIHASKILDPACGSGAFPMGVLHKLVYIIHKLDPDNVKWKQLQIDATSHIPDVHYREIAIAAIEKDFTDNEDDYGRKLYLIENCLYGVDIQPIAIQIAKLRFFISLICDQRTHQRQQENRGIRPLPNLETKFVAADTLIGLKLGKQLDLLDEFHADPEITRLEEELHRVRHDHFSATTRQKKLALQQRDSEIRGKLSQKLMEFHYADKGTSQKLADWNPYNPQQSADFFEPPWMFGQDLAEGFDIVIGNPPYVQIQKFKPQQKELWQQQGFATYAATADIYCLFYERGAKLLRMGGQLCYISSNKWMRAGYGDLLRGFLAFQVDTRKVLDFGMAQNFGAATTYTCIVSISKRPPTRQTLSCYATDDREAMNDPAGYFQTHHVMQTQLDDSPWVVIDKQRQAIKQQVEALGIPLAKWNIQINYGIKTGFNDAFYLTQQQRDQYIEQDPKCAELLVPLLRGRHITRYGIEWDGTWMINAHNGVKDSKIPPVNVEKDYPIIWLHLQKWKTELGKRQDKGEHWSNLRNCAYLMEFGKKKIVFQEIAITMPFYFDTSGKMFMDTTCFMITSDIERLEFLCAVLNSCLFRYCFQHNFPEYSGNAYRMKKIFMDKIPLKKPTSQQSSLFEKLVSLIQLAKKIGEQAPAHFLEVLIDACVFECYFREHMVERDLLFLDDLAEPLAAYNPNDTEERQLEFLNGFYCTQNAPASKIRNRLLRLTADSPDLLAVIKPSFRTPLCYNCAFPTEL